MQMLSTSVGSPRYQVLWRYGKIHGRRLASHSRDPDRYVAVPGIA